MAASPPTAVERCMRIHLTAVTDFLNLPDILRCMATNKLWRDHAINHPTYYGALQLLRRHPPGYVDFILLRLSRSAGRPVSVCLSLGAPHSPSLIQEFANHLAHVTDLTVDLDRGLSYAPILEALCRPAPILRRLRLLSSLPAWDPARPPNEEALRQLSLSPSALPADFFACHAPALDEVHMSFVAFGPKIPRCFSNISVLDFRNTAFGQHELVLPNPFERCPRLDVLQLSAMVTLDPAMCLARDGWARLSELWIWNGGLGDNWYQLPLPIANLPRIFLFVADAASARALADTITGTVEVAFRRRLPILLGHSQATRFFDAIFRSASNAGIRRDLSGALSTSGAAAVFGMPSLADRVVRLVLPVIGWDDLVGFSAFGPFNALKDLTLILATSDDLQSAVTAKLSCPRLQWLALRVMEGTVWMPTVEPVTVDIARVAIFARARLSHVVFPLKLELDGITLTGPCASFPVTFSSYASRTK